MVSWCRVQGTERIISLVNGTIPDSSQHHHGRAPAWVEAELRGRKAAELGAVLEQMLFSTEGGQSRQLQPWGSTVYFSAMLAAPGSVSCSLVKTTVPDCVGGDLLESPKVEG